MRNHACWGGILTMDGAERMITTANIVNHSRDNVAVTLMDFFFFITWVKRFDIKVTFYEHCCKHCFSIFNNVPFDFLTLLYIVSG
jgi:hypothetical protein